MTIVIDPLFSVYKLVERVESQSTLLRHRRTMSYVSYEIEQATLIDSVKTRIFAGFQYFSKFMPQAALYEKIAANAESVYIFGIPDVQLPAIPNVTYVPLSPSDQLSKEWFVISYGREYCSALATEELTQISDPDNARLFKGVWTFDMEEVSVLENWLTNTVEARPLIFREEEVDYRRQAQLMGMSLGRMMTKLVDMPQDGIVQGELKAALKEELDPAISLISSSSEHSEEREVVVVFSSLHNFNTLANTISSHLLATQIIDPFLTTVSAAVYGHGGVVDKLFGDSVLAVFGLDRANPDDTDRALAAAKEILRSAKAGSNEVGVGITSGKVLVRTIGSASRREETVTGEVVNMAQQLSQMAANRILVSDTVYDNLIPTVEFRSQGKMMGLKDRGQLQEIYQYRPALYPESLGA